MSADRPLMTEWVFHLAIAVAPEHVVEWHRDSRARGNCLLEDGVRVLNIEMDRYRRALERFRAEGAPFWHLLVQHHDGIADAHAGVHQFPIRPRHSGELGGPERLLLEFDRRGRVGTDKMRCDRMHPVRDRFYRGLRLAVFFLGLIHDYFVFLWFVWIVFKDITNGEQPSGREAENRAGAESRVAVKAFRFSSLKAPQPLRLVACRLG